MAEAVKTNDAAMTTDSYGSNQERGYGREMSGHDYGQGRNFGQNQYGRLSSIGVLTVSTSLVAAWDRCGVSVSYGGAIGLSKDDGPPSTRVC